MVEASRIRVVEIFRAFALLVALVAAAFVLTGCDASAEKGSPDATVEALLELRSENSTDAAAYRRHVEETSVVEAIVADAAGRKPGERPTPDWKDPKTSKRKGSRAEVRVEWVESKDFADWPEATTFIVRLNRGEWRVVDAVEASATAE